MSSLFPVSLHAGAWFRTGVVKFVADNRTVARTIWRYQEGSFKEVTEPSKSTADISG